MVLLNFEERINSSSYIHLSSILLTYEELIVYLFRFIMNYRSLGDAKTKSSKFRCITHCVVVSDFVIQASL